MFLGEFFDACRILIEAGAKFVPDGAKEPSLFWLLTKYNNSNQVASLIEQGIHTDYHDFHYALFKEYYDILKLIYDGLEERIKCMILLYFVIDNHTANVKTLLDFGADPNHVFEDPDDDIKIAEVDEGFAYLEGNIAITPTMYPIMTNNLELTDLLLQYGGDVHRANISSYQNSNQVIRERNMHVLFTLP